MEYTKEEYEKVLEIALRLFVASTAKNMIYTAFIRAWSMANSKPDCDACKAIMLVHDAVEDEMVELIEAQSSLLDELKNTNFNIDEFISAHHNWHGAGVLRNHLTITKFIEYVTNVVETGDIEKYNNEEGVN